MKLTIYCQVEFRWNLPKSSTKLITMTEISLLLGFSQTSFGFVKTDNKTDGNITFETISKEMFWNGYRIWNKRKKLMSYFWKNIAPVEWKLHGNKKEKKKKIFEPKECNSPFHFLEKHSNLSNIKPTPCHCSWISTRKQSFTCLDIRNFYRTQNADLANAKLHTNRDDLVLMKEEKSNSFL